MGNIWGKIGEIRTAFHMWLFLDSRIYKRTHNVIIPTSNGTTQIDHLIVSPYGLFIIETKSMKGWIFGSFNQKQWTQVIFGHKYYFQNPIKQTYRQKKGLAEYLEINELLINTIVYFNNNSRIKTSLPSNVINSNLARYIRSHQVSALSKQDIDYIQQKIDKLSSDPTLTTRNHIQSLRNRHGSITTCPKCGSSLIERTANKGYMVNSKFLGCTSYPKCRFTRNI